MISMLAGKPNPSTFPFSSVTVAIKPAVPGGETISLTLDGDTLTEGLQYGATDGLTGLVNWVTELQTLVHKRKPNKSWRVTIGSGSQDLIYKVRCP